MNIFFLLIDFLIIRHINTNSNLMDFFTNKNCVHWLELVCLCTFDSAKKDPFCPVLTLTGGVTMVFLYEIFNRNCFYPIQNWFLIIFYSCQFRTWALRFRGISLKGFDFFLSGGLFFAECTVFTWFYQRCINRFYILVYETAVWHQAFF